VASAPSNATRIPAGSSDGAITPVHARRNHLRYAVGELARYLGAVSILLVGAVHAQQYYDAYFSVVPTIGTLFLLSFISAAISAI
jgi:hypothetical protein